MSQNASKPGLLRRLTMLLRMAGAKPARWIIGVSAASLVLALLDMMGVAAMVPLMELVTTGSADGAATQWVASILGTDSLTTLVPATAAFVAIVFVVKSVGALAFRWWLLGRTTRVSALAASDLMRRYVLAPYADHRARRTTELYRNINDSTVQAASVLLAATTLVTDALLLIGVLLVLGVTSPWVTLFTGVFFASLIFGVQALLRKRLARIGETVSEASLEAWQFLTPGLDGFREARLTSSANALADGYTQSKLKLADASRERGFFADLPRYLLEVGFVAAIGTIAAVLFATTDAANTLTVLGVFAAASVRALPTMYRVSANMSTIRTGEIGLRILGEQTAELESGGRHEEAPLSTERYSGDITLRDVTFAYADATEPVLENVSLTIQEKRTTAFVGTSGAGKSTLIDLVLGLLDPTAGTIECGGRPITDDLPAWYADLGVVPQDVFLLNSSVAANVAFGEAPEQIDVDRVHEVLALAQLTEVVAELPEGLDTELGERGVRLSGGQRQRMGLARALYRHPKVLVLDEATSALDNETEHEIATTLAGLNGSMTILIVAHRLSTVRDADKLVFLRDGQVENVGTFTEVRDTNPHFARLVELGELS